jgi:tetratricopeptide (TPR) repeat protein
VNLNLTSAAAALKAVKGGLARFLLACCFSVLVLPSLCAPHAWAVAQRQPVRHKAASSASLNAELRARQQALDAARRTGNPSMVASASRALAALALRDYAMLQTAQGKAAQAVENYRRSIDLEDVPDAHLDLALACLNAGQSDRALAEVTDVLMADPQIARAWRVQGQVWMAKGNFGQAVESLQKSAALQTSSETSRLLQLALSQSKKPPSAHAEEVRRAALPEVPSLRRAELQVRQRRLRQILGSALNDLGTAEAQQQQFALALAHFHEAEQWQADTRGLRRNIGMAATRTGDYAEAARALRPVVASDPQDSVARSMLAMALFTTGSYAEAERTFKPLGDAALEHAELAYGWAESLVKLNRYQEAGALLGKLEGQPLTASTLVLVAQAWSEMGNYPRAVAACHRALQTDPNLAQAHSIAGLALIHEDRPADAAAEFRAQLQQDPASNEAEYHLAFVQFQLSQEQEAVQHLRNVLSRDPNHPDANYELGKALLNEGKTAEAIPYLEAAARLKPALDAVHYQLQSAYRSLGRKADADREANIYRAMKARGRNITLPPPRPQPSSSPQSQ